MSNSERGGVAMVESKSNDAIQLFEDRQIRTAWDEEKEEWYFSIVDVIEVLTDSPNPQTYWRVMKKRLKGMLTFFQPKASYAANPSDLLY